MAGTQRGDRLWAGDIVMFMGYVRIGARITILLTLCTAPLWSAVGEKVWMGIGLRPYEIAASGVILLGVTLAILSRDPGRKGGQGNYWAGVVFALIGGAGQGLGAVVSRKAYAVAQEQGVPLEGFSAAAQRVVSGWLGAFLMLTLLRSLMGGREFLNFSNTPWKKVWPWLLASTFCGPVVGVTCFQWALATTPSAIVNTLVATTPIAMIPLAMLINKDRPGILSVLGALIAVAGVLLMLNRGG